MNWKLIFYLSLITIIATTTHLVVQFILNNLWIIFLILTPFAITGGWVIYNFGQIVREKRLLIRAERKRSEIITTSYADYTNRNGQLIQLSGNPFLSWSDQPREPTPYEWQAFAMQHTPKNESGAILAPSLPQLTAPIPDHVYLEHYVSQPSVRNIFLGIGRYPDGQVRPVSAPLSRLVNIAIGGGSGFGKSVLMQSLAYQIINAREEVTPVFLDGQGVTFTEWHGNSRLLYPLASKPGDILAILIALIAEMGRREELFGNWRGVDSIDKYNSLPGVEPLPLIPVLFDEFGIVADDRQIANAAKKLAKGGRKVGMPSISSDQTWLASDISSAFRGNLSTSFQFYVRSKSLSRILIGDSGAVDLLRPGQCLAALPGQPGLIEMQAPDVSGLVGSAPQLIEAQPMPEMEIIQKPLTPKQAEIQRRRDRVTRMVQAGANDEDIAQEVYGRDKLAGSAFYEVLQIRKSLGF